MQNIPVALVSQESEKNHKDPKKNNKLKNILIIIGGFFVLLFVCIAIDYLIHKEKYNVNIVEVSNLYEEFSLHSGEEEKKVNEIFSQYAKKNNELLINDYETHVDKKKMIALIWLHNKISQIDSSNLEKDVVVMVSAYEFILNDHNNKYYTIVKKIADDTLISANIHYKKRQQDNVKFSNTINNFCSTGILSTVYCSIDDLHKDGLEIIEIDDELYVSVKQLYKKIHSHVEQSLEENESIFEKPSSIFI